MTGRDLIIYILKNNLEDEEVFKDGKLIGFVSVEEAALKFNVGVQTVKYWAALNWISNIKIGEEIYIPANVIKGDDK